MVPFSFFPIFVIHKSKLHFYILKRMYANLTKIIALTLGLVAAATVSCMNITPDNNRTSYFDQIDMTTEDSLDLWNYYEEFGNDSVLQGEDVQKHKKKFIRLVADGVNANKNTGFADFDTSRFEKGSLQYLANKYTYDILYNTTNPDVRLVAISCALFNDSLGADIKQFVEKTKKTYVRYVVQASDLNHATNYNDFMPNYEPGGNKPKNDSISYAQGYVDGKHWADSLSVKVDEADLMLGLTAGYRLAISGALDDKGDSYGSSEIWKQVIYYTKCYSVSFVHGLRLGVLGVTKFCEETYKAGAYYGMTGKRPKWGPDEMRLYLKKYPKIDLKVPPIRVKFPDDVQRVLDAKR